MTPGGTGRGAPPRLLGYRNREGKSRSQTGSSILGPDPPAVGLHQALAGGTLCEFRRRHLDDFRAVFAEVVRLARELALATLGRVSVDGTKVRANASKRKAMTYGRMVQEERRLQAEIAGLLKEAEAVDAAEDAHYGEGVRGDELPEELKRQEDRLAAIQEAKARLEAEQRAMDDARGRKPGQARNPKGGKPYKRKYGEPDEKVQKPLHGSREPDHEDEFGRVPAVLQRADGRGRGEPAGGGDGGDGQRERPGPADPDGRCGEG